MQAPGSHQRWTTPRLAVALGSALALALPGCPPADTGPTCLEMAAELADLDFAHLQAAVNMAIDITDYNAGLVSSADLRARYAPAGTEFELITVPNTIYVYMLLTNAAQQTQTIVLSGTITFNQWRLDALTQMDADVELGINLHSGWRAGARATRDDVEPRLLPGYRIRVYGYSLGGATAAILSLYLQHDGVDVTEVITCGQPRVTDETGVAALNALPLTRLISGNDNVPWWPFYPYAHGNEVLFLLDGAFVVRMQPGDADFDFRIETPAELDLLNPDDHVNYRARIADKVGVPVCDVPFGERQTYLEPSD